jgi:hypothetical protein
MAVVNKQVADVYYTSQEPRLLRDFDNNVGKYWRKVLSSHLGDDLADAILREARQKYEALIPELPYIGGKKNQVHTTFLIQSAWFLALYRALKSHGKTPEEAGKMVHEGLEALLRSYPKFLLRIVGRWQMSKSRLRRYYAESQKRAYPQDWKCTFVEGDGREFDFGMDYTECGICKFFHAQGADEFTPYICLLDFPTQKAMGTGLFRTMTIAEGAEKCDFRFKPGREVKEGWPPKFAKSRGK